MDRLVEQLRTYLKRNGYKLTRQRLAVLQGTLACGGQFDARALGEELKKRHLKVSRATLYRNMSLLSEAGIIATATLCSNGRTAYLCDNQAEHQNHIVCPKCGWIIEFSAPGLENLVDSICAAHAVTLVDASLQIRGYCVHCASGR
jgi:Fur family transcriptional regulator, ferric uptake regulator